MTWFKDIGYKKNPLDTNPFRFQEKTTFNSELVDELIYRIEAGNAVAIEGKKGYGKTFFLKQIINEFQGHGRVIYVDAKKLDKRLNISELLNKKYGPFKRLLGKKPKNMILLLDNVNELSLKNAERIKFYYDQNYLKSFVFTTENYKNAKLSESLVDRIGNRIIKLKKFSYEDSLRLLQELFPEFEEYIPNNILIKFYGKTNSIKEFLNKLNEYLTQAYEEDLTTSQINNILNDSLEEKRVPLCEECGTELEYINDEWMCPECDTYCEDCGTKVKYFEDECPGCGARFENE